MSSSLYPYTSFTNAGVTVLEVRCDNTQKVGCTYLGYLKQMDNTNPEQKQMGRVTIIELNFWCDWSTVKRSGPQAFCATCPWNRER